MACISPQEHPSVKVYQAEIVYENTNYDCHFLIFFVYKRQELFRKMLPCRKPLLDGYLKVEVVVVGLALVCNVLVVVVLMVTSCLGSLLRASGVAQKASFLIRTVMMKVNI